jgi:hypothetical protein
MNPGVNFYHLKRGGVVLGGDGPVLWVLSPTSPIVLTEKFGDMDWDF